MTGQMEGFSLEVVSEILTSPLLCVALKGFTHRVTLEDMEKEKRVDNLRGVGLQRGFGAGTGKKRYREEIPFSLLKAGQDNFYYIFKEIKIIELKRNGLPLKINQT